jgi:hypothetical protein
MTHISRQVQFSDLQIAGHLVGVVLARRYPSLTKMLKISQGGDEENSVYFSIEDNKILNTTHLKDDLVQLVEELRLVTPPIGHDGVYSDHSPNMVDGVLTVGLKCQRYPEITCKYKEHLKDMLLGLTTKKKSRSVRFTINSKTL